VLRCAGLKGSGYAEEDRFSGAVARGLVRMHAGPARDLAPIIAVIAKDRAPDRVNVYEIMTKPVLTLSPEMNIKYAARLLVEFKLTRALVVDEARAPIGMVGPARYGAAPRRRRKSINGSRR